MSVAWQKSGGNLADCVLTFNQRLNSESLEVNIKFGSRKLMLSTSRIPTADATADATAYRMSSISCGALLSGPTYKIYGVLLRTIDCSMTCPVFQAFLHENSINP